MGMLGDGLDKATAKTFTRPVPKSAQAQMRFLVKQEKGTRAVAALLGVSQRTVERYVTGQIKRPRKDLAARLEEEVRRRWQPRVRERARQRAATTGGIVIETRARFGFTAAPGSTDDARLRLVTQALPPTTPPASSPPSPRAPARTDCAPSRRRASRRSTSRTAAAAPRDCGSTSPTSTTSSSSSETGRRAGP